MQKQRNFEFAIHKSCERKKKKVILKLQDGNIIIGNVNMRKVFHLTMLLYTKVKTFLWKKWRTASRIIKNYSQTTFDNSNNKEVVHN